MNQRMIRTTGTLFFRRCNCRTLRFLMLHVHTTCWVQIAFKTGGISGSLKTVVLTLGTRRSFGDDDAAPVDFASYGRHYVNLPRHHQERMQKCVSKCALSAYIV